MKKPEEETLNLVAHQALLLDNVVHCGGLFLALLQILLMDNFKKELSS